MVKGPSQTWGELCALAKTISKVVEKGWDGISSDWQCLVDGGKRFEEAGWDGKPKEREFPHPDLGEYQHMDAT